MNVRGFQQLHDGPVVEFYPGRLWSLLDMLPSHAQKYINLGRDIENARLTFGFVEAGLQNSLKDDDIIRLHGHMGHMRDLCRELGLTTSSALLAKRLGDVPKTSREFELLVDTIELELNDRLFLYIPPHRAKYFDVVMPSIVTVAFPRASRELVA
ncbi:MAG TPA: hypothetical protein VGY52_00985, partial [Roseiarcus sp.]|nr:hypothetical protein [Roseiarcus sp.]